VRAGAGQVESARTPRVAALDPGPAGVPDGAHRDPGGAEPGADLQDAVSGPHVHTGRVHDRSTEGGRQEEHGEEGPPERALVHDQDCGADHEDHRAEHQTGDP
jgi:hypothetical protein